MERAAITCEGCRHKNYFPIDRNTQCNKCGKLLFRTKGRVGKVVRKVLVIGGAFAVGSVVTAVDLARDPGLQIFFRYPMVIEYEITERCVRASGGYLNLSKFYPKKEICLCALENTQLEFDFTRYKQEKKAMWVFYQKQVRECAGQILNSTLRRRLE